jgi:hypothetical protein
MENRGQLVRSALVGETSRRAAFFLAALSIAVCVLGSMRAIATSSGGTTATTTGNSKAMDPHWLRLVRAGLTFTAYSSLDGTDWTLISSDTIQMSATVSVGLAVTSQTPSTLATITFANVSVNPAQQSW